MTTSRSLKKMITDTILQHISDETLTVGAKNVLLAAGEVASEIFIVKSGCVRAWYNADGKDVTIQFFMPGQPVASFESLVNGVPSEYTLETVIPSEIVTIKGKDFRTWIGNHPEHHLELMNFAMYRLSSYQKLFLSRIKDTPQERYEALLAEHPEIVSQIPQHYIASYLGITPVSLSRIRNRIGKS